MPTDPVVWNGDTVTDVPANGHALLDFNAPLSDARSYDLISGLRALAGKDVVDYGCGWAELLLRIAAHEPGVRAVGVDDDEYAIGRGRAAVAERGLTNVTLHQADATTWPGRADVAISIGASHAWGGTQATLTALRERVTPGGLLLLGDGFWEHPPTRPRRRCSPRTSSPTSRAWSTSRSPAATGCSA